MLLTFKFLISTLIYLLVFLLFYGLNLFSFFVVLMMKMKKKSFVRREHYNSVKFVRQGKMGYHLSRMVSSKPL